MLYCIFAVESGSVKSRAPWAHDSTQVASIVSAPQYEVTLAPAFANLPAVDGPRADVVRFP